MEILHLFKAAFDFAALERRAADLFMLFSKEFTLHGDRYDADLRNWRFHRHCQGQAVEWKQWQPREGAEDDLSIDDSANVSKTSALPLSLNHPGRIKTRFASPTLNFT
jgi:hypothetical protein